MEWKKTNKRFIGFFDIMGFKDLVQRTPHAEVYKRLDKIKDFLNFYEGLDSRVGALPGGKDNSTIVKHVLFSDSILIVSAGDSAKDIQHLIYRCNHFIWHCFENGIPIKGAISHGTLTADFEKSIFFGQPLIDAYLLQDEITFYGAVIENNAERQISKLKIKDSVFLNKFYPYEVPTKSGKIRHLCLKWLSRKPNGDMSRNIRNVTKFYHLVSGKPRIYVDNTLKFVDWVIEKKQIDSQK